VPEPGRYRPIQFTEASHAYSFPRAEDDALKQLEKTAMLPGPGRYENMKEMKD